MGSARQKAGEAAQLIKQPHFEFKHAVAQEDPQHYMSEMRRSYGAPPASAKAGVGGVGDDAARKYFKEAHFSIGSQGESRVTTKEDYHTSPLGKAQKAALDAAQVKDLRSEHFDHGKTPGLWLTQYKYAHKWIQPVSDEVPPPA